jgi:hypothetical protein
VLSYLWLAAILAGSFLGAVDAGFLILEPGPPTVLSAWGLVQDPQAFDFGGAGSHDYPLDGGVQVSGGPSRGGPRSPG